MDSSTNLSRRLMMKGMTTAAVALSTPQLIRAARAISAPSAIVIGSGIAGLSAAYELEKAGFLVKVFEKHYMPGGRMRDDWMGPLFGEVHAEEIFEGNKEMFALADELGISKQFTVNQPDGPMTELNPVDNGKGVYGTATRLHMTEVLQIPGLSNETRQKLPSLLPDLAEIRETVDPCLLHTGAAWDDESLWGYMVRKLGFKAAQEFTDDWIDVAWLWPWGYSARDTSKIALLAFVAQQDKRWINPPRIGLLTEKLAFLLDIQQNTTVTSVTPANSAGRHTVNYLSATGQRISVTPDVVVCATEGNYVIPIVQGLSQRQNNFFKKVHLTQNAFVIYILKDGHGPKEVTGNMRRTKSHPDGITEIEWVVIPGNVNTTFDLLDYRKRTILFCNLPDAHLSAWRESGKSLPDYCLPLMQKEYPPLTEEIIDDAVTYAGDGLVIMNTGLPSAMAEFIQDQEKERRGLYFTGEYLSNAHTGGACASGRTVARAVTGHWMK